MITKCPYLCGPDVLFHPDCTTKSIPLDYTGVTDGVIKAGTPINAAGRVANDSTAIGVLRNDCYKGFHHSGNVIIGGYINQDKALENSGMVLSDEAKASMTNILFVDALGVPYSGLPSGGAPYQQLVTDGNGKTQWEDRLAYAAGHEEKELLPEQTYSGDEARLSGNGELVIGKTYSVMFDGAEYDCICVVCDGCVILGNASLWGIGDDTGEPFLLQDYGNALYATSSDLLATHTISISYVDENIKTIDNKFLPKDFIVNIVGKELDGSGNIYLLFDKTDEEINNALTNGSTVKLNYNGEGNLQYNLHEERFWGILPGANGTNGITKLKVVCVENLAAGWYIKQTYITASTSSDT